MAKIDYADYVFCLTGAPSGGLQALRGELTRSALMSGGKLVHVSYGECGDIVEVRNGCMSRNDVFSADQKPFEGELEDYGYLIWYDSDQSIKVEDIERLVSYDLDYVCGWARQSPLQIDLAMDDANNKASCGIMKGRNGGGRSPYTFTVKELFEQKRNDKGLVEVDYSGFPLVVIKKGVVEKMTYPWFRKSVDEWMAPGENGQMQLYARNRSEDEEFCLRAKSLGFKIYVDPEVYIPHQKMVWL